MITVNTIIERPASDVWAYLARVENWKQWWGGGVKAVQPGWQNGAQILWELGGSSTLLRVEEGKLIVIQGAWMDSSITLTPQGDGATLVELVEGDPKGGASFSDGGAAQRLKNKESLEKLKKGVESRPATKVPVAKVQAPLAASAEIPPASPTPEPRLPVPAAAKKGSEKTWLWALILVIVAVVGVAAVTLIVPLFNKEGTGSAESLTVENETWRLQILSTSFSDETLRDNQGGTISPNPGFTFLVIETALTNLTSEPQTLVLGMLQGPGSFVDKDGVEYVAAGLTSSGMMTLQSTSSLTMSYIYPNGPDGEVVEFIFPIPEGVAGGIFTFIDLPPIELDYLNSQFAHFEEESLTVVVTNTPAPTPVAALPTEAPAQPTEAPLAAQAASGPPRIGTVAESREAYDAETPFLGHLADDPEISEVSDEETLKKFSLTLPESQDVMAGNGWCAIDQATLIDNLTSMEFMITVNGVVVPADEFIITEYETDDNAYCHEFSILLTDWPAGAHLVNVYVIITAEISDGWELYSPHTSNNEYHVTVEG